jgi:hypothetical protein
MQQPEEGYSWRKSAPRGDDGRGEFAGNLVPLREDDVQRLFRLILLNPSSGGHSADLGEKREPRETACVHCRQNTVMKESLTPHHRDGERQHRQHAE